MKKITLRNLVAAAMMMLGTGVSYAQATSLSLNSSESAYTDASEADVAHDGTSVDYVQYYYTQYRDWGNSDGTVKINAGGKIAFFKFDLSSLKQVEGTITAATFSFVARTADGKVSQSIRVLGYNHEWNAATLTNNNLSNSAGTILGTVNDTGSFQPVDTKTEFSYTSGTGETISAEVLTYLMSAIDADKDYVTFAIVANHARAGLVNTTATLDVTISKAERANYTVKYVYNGTEIKTAVTRDGEVGASIVLEESDKEGIVYNNQKYVYSSDDSANKTIASDGSTVVTVTFVEASKYSYTVNSSLGTVIASGEGYEQDVIKYYYPQYELSGTDLYEAARQTVNPWYGKSFTLTTDEQVEIVSYTQKEGIFVYYAEGENIDGATVTEKANADIRCSAGKGGFFGENTILTTLPAGKYKITGNVWGNTGTTFVVKAGEDEVWTLATTGSRTVGTSEEFVLSSETDLIIVAAGDNNHMLDNIFIEKTGDVTPTTITATIADCGYATLCSPYALDFTDSDVKAFIVEDQEVSDKVVTTEVTKVPAGAGIILKGEVGSCTINTTTEEVEELTNNMMVGVLVDTNLDDNCGYILYTDGLFHPCGGGTLAAGKAYLGITPPASQAGAKPLTIVFEVEGTTTAVKNVETNVSNESIYTLSGTRLNGQPTQHGVYIIGGKKVVK